VSPTASHRFIPENPRRSLLGLLWAGLVLLPGVALAEKDGFGLGNGQHGALQVRDTGVVINASTGLASDAHAGATELSVENASSFAAGELVLVLQMGDTVSLAQSREDALDLESAGLGVGRWELARLAGTASGVLRLSAPLVKGFTPLSQVVRVPEYTDVRVSSNGSLRAPSWNGRVGGVLAFLATGTVFNQGLLDADGMGLRGGAAERGVAVDLYDCAELDGPATSGGGARKGEGLASRPTDALAHGYARFANGGGGGNCHDAGGGGGGHIGRGGQGGRSSQEAMDRDVGGRGGMALRYPPLERLLLGGGGGAGIEGSAGGAGGGIVFVRAREIQGPRPRGIITANGVGSLSDKALHGGGGGGGAGGTVHVRVSERLGCTVLSAKGGVGADSGISPGGGGGGGLLLVQAPGGVPSECTASVSAGLSGYTPEGARGAEPIVAGTPEFEGRVEVIDQAFAEPPAPTGGAPDMLDLRVGFGCGVVPDGRSWGLGLVVLAWASKRARRKSILEE
jgi:hypothetical protein